MLRQPARTQKVNKEEVRWRRADCWRSLNVFFLLAEALAAVNVGVEVSFCCFGGGSLTSLCLGVRRVDRLGVPACLLAFEGQGFSTLVLSLRMTKTAG